MQAPEFLQKLAPLRLLEEPDGARPLCVIVLSRDLRRLPVWLRRRQHFRLAHILVADVAPGTPMQAQLPPCHGTPTLEGGLARLADCADCDVVFLFTPEYLPRVASMAIQPLARRQIYIAGQEEEIFNARAPLPDFYEKNAARLEAAAALLHDDADREVFWRRVKAISSGNPGYLPIASHMEYEHPQIRPLPGDIMIDGGVSDMVGAQERFAALVGEKGAIHGFEPIPWMAQKASAQLAPLRQYHLHCAGLAEKSGEASFASLRDSSHLGAQTGAESIKCRLDSIDEFAARQKLPRLDCLKLDIEGAELAALKGGAQTIRLYKPRLIICAYHKPQDLWELPQYVQELCPQYQIHLAHSTCGFTDTILYAKVP